MRKTKPVVVPELPGCDNRDLGKHFLITEWDSHQADRWAQKLTYALMRNGEALPLDLRGVGWEGIAVMGINSILRGSVDPNVMIPLGEELLECVQIVPDKQQPKSARPATMPGDIEEVQTRWWLRDQVVSVHTNFSFLDALSRLASSIMSKVLEGSSTTPTSRPGSDS